MLVVLYLEAGSGFLERSLGRRRQRALEKGCNGFEWAAVDKKYLQAKNSIANLAFLEDFMIDIENRCFPIWSQF